MDAPTPLEGLETHSGTPHWRLEMHSDGNGWSLAVGDGWERLEMCSDG